MTTGLKISDYINKLRVEKANTLLTETNKTIIEIAFRSWLLNHLEHSNRVFAEMKMNRDNSDKNPRQFETCLRLTRLSLKICDYYLIKQK